MQALNPWTPSFLDSPPDTSTPACVSLGFNGSNWIDHQGVENFFSLKTLNLCEGKLLKDLRSEERRVGKECSTGNQIPIWSGKKLC